MAFMAKQRAQAHYNAGTRILANLNPSSSSKKDHIRAVNHLQKAVELDPNSAYSYHNLGYAWYKLAEHEHLVASAHRQFKNMQEVENSIMGALDNGHDDMVEKIREQYVKEQAGDGLITGYFVFALQAVDRALEIQYDFPQAHNTRAMVLAKLGRLDEAIEATEVALLRDPNYKNASDNREKMKELRRQA
jgi:tetratricopeptide (TPR) repeat protein